MTNPQPPVLGDSNPAISPDGRSLVFRRNFGYVTINNNGMLPLV